MPIFSNVFLFSYKDYKISCISVNICLIGPSCLGPSFGPWAKLSWAEFLVGRAGIGPNCPAPVWN